jgi:hypothetical protein
VEVFKANENHVYRQYEDVRGFLGLPQVEAVLRGEWVDHPKSPGNAYTKTDVIRHISRLLWGSEMFVEHWREEWRYAYYEDCETPVGISSEAKSRLIASEALFWDVAMIATLTWIRSPHALPFLIQYHPIYYAVFDYNADNNTVKVVPGSGGVAFAVGWSVYTLAEIEVERGVEGGSCVGCKQPLHCTKLIHVRATTQPVCYCGTERAIDVSEAYMIRHKTIQCDRYNKDFPDHNRAEYVCIRCLFNRMNKLHEETRCGRTLCPAVKCPHHMGQQAYLRAITHRKTMLLAHAGTR